MHHYPAPTPDRIGARRTRARRGSVALAVLLLAAAAPAIAREWFVSTEGDDQGRGSLQQPFRTVGHALGVARGGDTITLRAPPGNRTYEECDLRLRVPLVLRSHPGERAHLHCAITTEDSVVVKVDPGGSGSRISNLEISGGSIYGVMLHSHWYQGAPASEHGARDVVLEDLLIRDTGRDGIKITPKSDNATIRRVEIRDTGRIYAAGTAIEDMNADGIDNVNGSGMTVEDSHIHGTATTGLYFKGGAADVLVQRNRIENTGMGGILVGFDTSPDYLDPEVNPAWHEAVRAVVRNNVVRNTGYAGIGLYAARDALVANNTIIDAARQGHASLFFGIALQDWDERAGRPPSVNPRIVNNLVVGGGRCIEIRQLSELGGLVGLEGAPGTDYNAYPAGCEFVDQRTVAGRLAPKSLAQWKLQAGADAHSMAGGFRVDASGRLADGSAVPGPGIAVAGLADDITGAPRSGDMVIGAYGGMPGGAGALAPPSPGPVEAAGRDSAGAPTAPGGAPAPAVDGSQDRAAADVVQDVVEGAAGLLLAVLPGSPLGRVALALLLAALAATVVVARLFQRRNMGVWLLSWLRQDWRAPVPAGTTRHLLFCFVDHYEPGWGSPGAARERARVARWRRDLPLLCARHRDADGRPPVHSFFFPGDEYRPEHVDSLVELCRMGLGEIEVHLHHQGDTSATLRAKLADFTAILASRHDALPRDHGSGQPRWAFIHGDWALDNSHPGGGHCGVDDELIVLREEGCYADFTFPAAPDPCQPRTINRIYRATDDPLRPKSHDTGERVRVGGARDGDLMIIQGPLGLNWRSRKFGLLPRIENGDVRAVSPPLPGRIDAWVKTGIHVEGRPEWTFVKVHTHGAEDADMDTLLGPSMDRAFSHLESRYNDGTRWKLHYVSAREMYNIARAAEDGRSGDPGEWRDYEVPRPGYRQDSTEDARTAPAVAAAVAS